VDGKRDAFAKWHGERSEVAGRDWSTVMRSMSGKEDQRLILRKQSVVVTDD